MPNSILVGSAVLHSSTQSVPILYNEPPPQKLPLPWVSETPPSNTQFLGPTRVLNPNCISIGSTVFARLTTVSDKQTDHATRSVTVGRIYVRSTAMRPKMQWSLVNV